jgi:hypothetical protein
MASTSQTQQRLMGQAYAVRQFMDSNGKKGLNPEEIDSKYREKIEDLAKNMSKQDLKDFATKLEENSPIATLGSVNGMGFVSLPGADGKIGSGDIPLNLNKTKKVFKRFKEFTLALQESSNQAFDNVYGSSLYKFSNEYKSIYNRIYNIVSSVLGSDLAGTLNSKNSFTLFTNLANQKVNIKVIIDTTIYVDINYGKATSFNTIKDIETQLNRTFKNIEINY